MRGRWLGFLGLFPWVIALAANSNAGDVVKDLEAVRGMEWYRGPEAGKALLAKNGFVVTTDFQYDIHLPYMNLNIPNFVTADSVHRTFHVLFEEHLKQLEQAFAGDLLVMLAALRADIDAQAPNAVAGGALAPMAEDAKILSVQFFEVAQALLSGEADATRAPDAVAEEVTSILSASGVGFSPLFGYLLDYSQFKPRGFYTESPELQRYFRALSWFGNAAFLLHDERQTLAALMIAKALRDSPAAQRQWQKMDAAYTAFLAPCDDLTPLEYGAMLPEFGALDSRAALEAAAARLRAELRDPAINSMVLLPEEMGDWVALTKGMRFLGKRYVPDSEIFLALIAPEVANRKYPSGLDVMAANGSARAAELMAGTPTGQQPDYIAGARQSKARLDAIKAEGASQYARFLQVAETLTAPPVAQAAPFARTAAYADKNLMTGLAAWSSTRHAWALHAKQSASPGMGGPDAEEVPPGYVEPNPAFFLAMGALVQDTIALFEAAGAPDLQRFTQFESLVEELAEIVRKELAGEPFSEDEQYLLCMYGERLKGLRGSGSGISTGSPWMSQVMDVHTDYDSERCLEVGTGGAMPIYVVLEHQGRPYLLVGGVYSYYEFLRPIEERLTDEAWRDLWDRGRIPELPPWTVSFVAGKDDIVTIIQRLRNGEQVAGLEFIQDPALDAYLIQNVAPDSPSLDHDNVAYLFQAASRRAPEVVNPILITMIRDGAMTPGDEGGNRGDVAAIASAGITGNVRDEDVPLLVDIMVSTDAPRAERISYTLLTVQSKLLEASLVAALGRCSDPVIKYKLIDFIRMKASVDRMPELLERARAEQGAMKIKCLVTLAAMWDCWSREACGIARVTSIATEDELKRWKAQLDEDVLMALATFDWRWYSDEHETLRRETKEVQEQSIKERDTLGSIYGNASISQYRWLHFQTEILKELAQTAGMLRLAGAEPFLEDALRHADRETTGSILDALMAIGTDEAADVLAASIGSPRIDSVLTGGCRRYLSEQEIPETVLQGNVLIRLLENTAGHGKGDLRVCDLVVGILSAVDMSGSPGLPVSAGIADRDAKAAAWIGFLRERPRPANFDEDERFGRVLAAPGTVQRAFQESLAE